MTGACFDIAVTGATGITGEAVLDQLLSREFPVGNLHLLGEQDAVGERVPFGDGSLRVVAADGFAFPKVQLVFAAGEARDPDLIARAIEAGCHVIDVGGRSGFETDLPPVVAAVNEHAIALCATQRFYRNPSCTSILLWKVLKPVYDLCGIERVDVTVLQAVSERGRRGIEELAGQTARLLN
ncbi:MAG TPA: aspartate-semialdehyde dehydrogenase, partial [Chromatiales bacterium]|nr:aspartate-semialdehyde dehydrogenase [Chromatiales bacterium]